MTDNYWAAAEAAIENIGGGRVVEDAALWDFDPQAASLTGQDRHTINISSRQPNAFETQIKLRETHECSIYHILPEVRHRRSPHCLEEHAFLSSS